MTVPEVVFELTFTTMVKTAVSPVATVALEKTTLPVPPTAGALVDQPVPVVTEADTNVVLAGVASVTVTVCASDGPLLVKLIVYVTLLPAKTGSGESLLLTGSSADACTVVAAVPVLLAGVGSVVALTATALLLIVVPLAVLAFTLTTIEKTATSPATTVAFAKTTLPVPPTGGGVMLQP